VQKRRRIAKAGEEISSQGDRIIDSVKLGHQTESLARQAMMALRGQRDQIVNTVGLVREIGRDVVRSENIAKDLDRRSLLNLVVLYLIIIILFFTNVMVLYFKLHF
jgi:hypothetical protein